MNSIVFSLLRRNQRIFRHVYGTINGKNIPLASTLQKLELPKLIVEHVTKHFFSSDAAIIPVVEYAEIKNLSNHGDRLLIDVREPDELVETGKIPTSINIPLGIVSQELTIDAKKFQTKYGRPKPAASSEIIFHCKSGKRSLIAAETAFAMGFKNVKNYQGSWSDWVEHEEMDNENIDENLAEPNKELRIFGRDVSQIPCFRNSFLYGFGGGFSMGLLTFLGTSRTHLSSHVGFSSFFCTTIGYWFYCRYQWSKQRFDNQQLQEAMRRHAMYEGTDIERDLLKSA